MSFHRSFADPEVIAIGGGESHARDFLFKPLQTKVFEKTSSKAMKLPFLLDWVIMRKLLVHRCWVKRNKADLYC